MEYLKIWCSFAEIIEPLNDSERGRLFTAMLEYAGSGALPEFKGNERYVWPIAKQAIDRARAESEKQTANGAKGGRPRNNPEKPTETQQNPTKPTESLKEKDKDKDKDKIKKETYTGAFEAFWNAYPRHTNKKAALQAFQRINPDAGLLNIMLQALAAWCKSQQWTKDGGQFIPHPATWLNGRRWEDELPKAYTGKAVSAQNYQQREYSENELLDVSDDLIAEARAQRSSA